MGKQKTDDDKRSHRETANDGDPSVHVHHTPVFGRLSDEKRARILNTAASEFALRGFAAANINIIAKKAGISIGSMYKYFESKEALFLAVGENGYALIEEALSQINMADGDIFDKFERMFRAVQIYSRRYPELNRVYLDMASEGLAHLSRQLSRKMETITAVYFRKLLRDAREQGLIAPDLDEPVTAFCLDNLIITLQYSYSSQYFSERMKIFAGENALEDDEKTVQGIMRFIRGALSPIS
jgi:AcrR family transcriptional regulator